MPSSKSDETHDNQAAKGRVSIDKGQLLYIDHAEGAASKKLILKFTPTATPSITLHSLAILVWKTYHHCGHGNSWNLQGG
jgi:hypothetical protein